MINEACKVGLMVDETKLGAIAQRPSSDQAGHDELSKWFWRATECLPRWELENDPPPPRARFRWGPTGQRTVGKSARNGVVRIDSHAKAFYSRGVPPWSSGTAANTTIEFVDTATVSIGTAAS